MHIDYTSEFKRHLRGLKRRYRSIQQDLQTLIEDLQSGQVPGDLLSGIDGYTVYKVRIQNSDAKRGKSGGYRVIYYVKSASHITLLAVYSKSDQADIHASTLRRILEDL